MQALRRDGEGTMITPERPACALIAFTALHWLVVERMITVVAEMHQGQLGGSGMDFPTRRRDVCFLFPRREDAKLFLRFVRQHIRAKGLVTRLEKKHS